MNLPESTCRSRFAAARVARLATVGADGVPHLVPVTFAVAGDEVFIAIDHKPKTTLNLRRLRNIAANPAVTLLVDEYDDDDWTQLWWVRADGTARVQNEAVESLVTKYPQYVDNPPQGPVIVVRINRWSGWSFA
ncbi:TIGR03668 family PPOX class F420-dependent oxidoreductase [Kribbella albertanoniae]|uniref:TIGR03668 family PPOX class F420-dependent oxidoreductase n=1 Tax=Kribbella albertanoniae TaxID=1266829 RepID=A0A4R4QHI6_9ACTN|nr:TIGR03668 family PPOX class F420-dependent oxidoreductase [Kribbella albertanoniae]TDC34642.1 TIGR03668 family PPOX class F420-dependent oxidoreductase [Kribbella albertanoniae]